MDITWWEGDLMAMSARRVFALTSEHVVMCYARKDIAACKFARNSADSHALLQGDGQVSLDRAATNTTTVAQEPLLLPPLMWSEPQRFDGGQPVGRVEAERLTNDRFVVCFERLSVASPGTTLNAAGGLLACTLGHVEVAADGSTVLGQAGHVKPFAAAIELGHGSLIAISVVEAGRRFAVCHRDTGIDGLGATCCWLQVQLGDGVGDGSALLRRTDDAELQVFSTESAHASGT